MSTALSVAGAYERVRDPLEFMRVVGDDIAKSGMFGCQTVEQGRILALTCLKKGLDPMSLVETYHLIQGDLSMRADAMLAGLSRVGGKYRVIRRTPEAAEIEIQRDQEKQTFSLTWEEAKEEPFTKNKKGEIKDNYATPRSRMQMLWARVVSDGVRTMWPEVVCGAYTPEEMQDFATASTGQVSTSASEPIDASFTVVPEPVPVAKSTPQPQTEEGYCTAAQAERIRELFVSLQIDADTQVQILAKRKVNSARSLTTEQATELIGKLESQLAAASKSSSEPVAGPAAPTMRVTDPATAEQVASIKTLITEIEQREPGTVSKVAAKLKECGLAKLADLNYQEAKNLEDALRVKNLATFFEASLAGFKPGN